MINLTVFTYMFNVVDLFVKLYLCKYKILKVKTDNKLFSFYFILFVQFKGKDVDNQGTDDRSVNF